MFKQAKKTILGAALGALISAPVATSAAEQWSMATSWGGGPFLEQDAKGWANLVDTLTAGRIKIQVFPGGTLGKALKVSDTVKSNVAQTGHTWMGYDWGIDKATVVFAGMAGGQWLRRMVSEERFRFLVLVALLLLGLNLIRKALW